MPRNDETELASGMLTAHTAEGVYVFKHLNVVMGQDATVDSSGRVDDFSVEGASRPKKSSNLRRDSCDNHRRNRRTNPNHPCHSKKTTYINDINMT
jgi:hypothetical protein